MKPYEKIVVCLPSLVTPLSRASLGEIRDGSTLATEGPPEAPVITVRISSAAALYRVLQGFVQEYFYLLLAGIAVAVALGVVAVRHRRQRRTRGRQPKGLERDMTWPACGKRNPGTSVACLVCGTALGKRVAKPGPGHVKGRAKVKPAEKPAKGRAKANRDAELRERQ